MLQVAHQLCRAGAVRAVISHLTGRIRDRLTTGRAVLRYAVRLLVTATDVYDRANHIRDHLTSPLDQHPVTDPDIFFLDKVKIMQCRLFYNHPANLYRLQNSIGCNHPCATHVDTNVVQLRGHFLRREFISNRTSWILPRNAQLLRQDQVVDFDHHPIHLVGEGVGVGFQT